MRNTIQNKINFKYLEKFVNYIPFIIIFVISGNILSASLMNFFEMSSVKLPLYFFISGLIGTLLFKNLKINFPKLNKKESIIVLLLTLLIAFPRIPYLLEPFFNTSLNAACWDDWWHIQEFSSLIYTNNYPPKSTFNNNMFLSFYYAPWIVGAALFKLGMFETIKQALFITNLLYSLIFSYAIFISSKILYNTSIKIQKSFIIMLVFYGGFDFVYGLTTSLYNVIVKNNFEKILTHSEWWMGVLGFKLQFSNFFTLSLWVPHHLSSAIAILFGLYLIYEDRKKFAFILTGICFSFALFSSVFVVIGAIPIILYLIFKIKKIRRTFIFSFIVSLIISTPMLWMYLDKNMEGFILLGALHDFWKFHLYLSFPIFLIILSLEFLPIVVVLFIYKQIDHYILFIIAIIYLISTFFISFSGANNYAIRGSIIPILVIIYVTAPLVNKALYEKKKIMYFLFIPFFLGGIWEYLSFTKNALNSYSNSFTSFNKRVYQSNIKHGSTPNENLILESKKTEYGWYLIENRKNNNKEFLKNPDIEIMNSDNIYRIKYDTLLFKNNQQTVKIDK